MSSSRGDVSIGSTRNEAAQRPGASLSSSHEHAPSVSAAETAAQRPGASLSSSLSSVRPNGRFVSICSTPGGVVVEFTAIVVRSLERLVAAQRPGASLSSSLRLDDSVGDFDVRCSTPGGVVVEFTTKLAADISSFKNCSTPWGVVVEFTQIQKEIIEEYAKLLNARGRRCRVHIPTTNARAPKVCCSTPGGVVVEFTTRSFDMKRVVDAAQRPGASLSSSHRLRSDASRDAGLLNARGRRCRVHRKRSIQTPTVKDCSTPGGVVVEFTGNLHPLRRGDGRLLNARGRRCRVHRLARGAGPGPRSLLNARGRRCRVHFGFPGRSRVNVNCSTPGGVVVEFTPRAGRLRRHGQLLNARGRRCRVHSM